MEKKKPNLPVVLVLAILVLALVTLVSCSVAFDAPTNGTVTADSPRITLSRETANPGEDVEISVDLDGNPGLMVIMLRVGYDPEALAFTGVAGEGLSDWDRTGDTILWLGGKDSDFNGTVAKLLFRVLETAPAGESAVTLTCKRGDVGNHDEEAILPEIIAGGVTVLSSGTGTESGGTQPSADDPGTVTLPFTDVAENSYYFAPVCWAWQNGITAGRGEDFFDPAGTCTRGEAVTFLWRAAGKPEPESLNNPFSDVSEENYFFKAVLWAVERGITLGTDATHFSPQKTCSSAEIVTFVYRALGIGSDGWYQAARDWADFVGLLDGTGLITTPDEACPRSAVVTFLYRWSLLTNSEEVTS